MILGIVVFICFYRQCFFSEIAISFLPYLFFGCLALAIIRFLSYRKSVTKNKLILLEMLFFLFISGYLGIELTGFYTIGTKQQEISETEEGKREKV
ncbi:hypothetical protein IJM86_00260 [bacterium]|nr:hypothetical protein [bacterium]